MIKKVMLAVALGMATTACGQSTIGGRLVEWLEDVGLVYVNDGSSDGERIPSKDTVALTRFAGERITGLSVRDGFDVELIRTSARAENRVEIVVERELEEYLEAKLDGGTVRLGWEKRLSGDRDLRHMASKLRPRVRLYLGELEGIELSGSGRVRAADSLPFSGGSVTLKTSGSGSIRGLHLSGGRLDAGCSGSGKIEVWAEGLDEAEASVSGSGAITLSGSGAGASYGVSGSGKIRARDFRVQRADVSVSGSGSVELHAEQAVEGSISGSGSVRYAGNPDVVKIKKSGSGSVHAL